MMTIAIREEIHRLVDAVPDEELDEVRESILELLREPADLTDCEKRDFKAGLAELRRGEWVWWEDAKRKDV